MNKKLIIGISAAAVAAVIIGAAAALMTSSPPEKIDLSSTHTTEAATEPAKDTEPETPPAVTTAPETTAAAVENVTASLDTYTFGNISIQFPKVETASAIPSFRIPSTNRSVPMHYPSSQDMRQMKQRIL